jgi:[protein-PII] uridylyltransferase
VRGPETEDGALISGRLWALPQAYVLSADLEEIKRHIALSSGLTGPDDVKVEIFHRRNHTQITIITRDKPGLFALLTGILAINRMDVISANIFTWYDGTVVDTFKVNPPWSDYREWDNIEKQFREFNTGAADITSRIKKTRALKTETPSPLLSAGEVTVVIDNLTSDFFTIIDVKAHKRVSLVHDISSSLSALSLDIHRAFLTLNSDLISCVFYVVDSGGEKIDNPGVQQTVITKIRESVSSFGLPPSPGSENKLYNTTSNT